MVVASENTTRNRKKRMPSECGASPPNFMTIVMMADIRTMPRKVFRNHANQLTPLRRPMIFIVCDKKNMIKND